MYPVVHSFGCFGGRHHADMVMRAGRVDCEATFASRWVNFGFGSARHNMPLEQPLRSTEGQDQAVSLS
eukprot:5076719-Pleurochrysis_carterae.AAC.1